MTPQNSGSIENGLDKLSAIYSVYIEQLADERIVDYMCYQVYRLRDMMVSKRATFGVSWYFSDNAIKKYQNQFMGSGKSGMMYYIDQWLMSKGLSRSKLTQSLKDRTEHSARRFVAMPSEEPVKMRMHNKPEGYSLCQISTTGWAPSSFACNLCDYNARCHEETRRKYPELVRLREETMQKKENKV